MTATDENKDLNTAITELIYDLKGDWSLSSLSSKIGVSRNRLAAIFEVYNAKSEARAPQFSPHQTEEHLQNIRQANEDSQKAPADPAESSDDPKKKNKYKRLYWEITPLMAIANALDIRVSELIQAAEDIQDGLPPWFNYRINKYMKDHPEHTERCLFFEAFGYRSYIAFDILKGKDEDKWRRRSSSYPSKNQFFDCSSEDLEYFTSELTADKKLIPLAEAYRDQRINHKETYHVLKDAVDKITEQIRNKNNGLLDNSFSANYLFMAKNELAKAIHDSFLIFNEQNDKKHLK